MSWLPTFCLQSNVCTLSFGFHIPEDTENSSDQEDDALSSPTREASYLSVEVKEGEPTAHKLAASSAFAYFLSAPRFKKIVAEACFTNATLVHMTGGYFSALSSAKAAESQTVTFCNYNDLNELEKMRTTTQITIKDSSQNVGVHFKLYHEKKASTCITRQVQLSSADLKTKSSVAVLFSQECLDHHSEPSITYN